MAWKISQILLGFAVFIFIALCIWADQQIPFLVGGPVLLENPWGIVTLVDFYLGICLFSGFVLIYEPQKMKAWIWALLPFLLGNVVGLVYILLNGRKIYQSIRQI